MSTLYTWRDVEKLIQEVSEPPWTRISVAIDTVTITCTLGRRDEARGKLEEIFGSRFSNEGTLGLESALDAPRSMTIAWEEADEDELPARRAVVRPLWSDAHMQSPTPTPVEENQPKLLAFYSYKGGVGRTTTLMAVLGALLSMDKKGAGRPARVLIVDADIEAPGLTWNISGPPDRFCLFDLLGLVHDIEDWSATAIPIAVERLWRDKQSVELPSGLANFFFLPVCRDEDQLFRPPIDFEQVVRGRGRANVIAEMFSVLGQKLEVDVILVDLRAGVTEFSSPLLLDPRVQTILVSSCNQQSVEGTLMVLERMKARTELETAPEVLLNMIPTTFTEDQIGAITSQLLESIPSAVEDDPAGTAAQSSVHEAMFAEQLFHFDSLGDLLSQIQSTPLGRCAEELGRRFVRLPTSAEKSADVETSDTAPGRRGSMQAIADLAERLEYAEGNAVQGLLPTPALDALVDQSLGAMPTAVVLGGKGAGKTYAWGQMVIVGEWDAFARMVNEPKPAPKGIPSALIFPLLGPQNAQDMLRAKLRDAERRVWEALGVTKGRMTQDDLAARLSSQSFGGDELAFWAQASAARLGLPEECGISVEALAAELTARKVPIVLVVDGLEDSFQPGPRNPLTPDQQRLLRGLLHRFSTLVRDLRSRHLGLVTFVRRDLAEAAIPQNFGQFEKQHQRFILSWSPTEALRLVAWVLERAGRAVMDAERIPLASYEELRSSLESLWGERMGSEKSKEAYSDRWVLAALSDFQARLQPRDVVRLLRYAALEMQDDDAQLTPASLRTALVQCSRNKVAEIEREIPMLEGIFNRFRAAMPDDKRIPFRAESFDLSPEEVVFLETHGVVFRDAQGDLFMPEIIRHGLDFKMDRGRRPPVLAMYRRATRVRRG